MLRRCNFIVFSFGQHAQFPKFLVKSSINAVILGLIAPKVVIFQLLSFWRFGAE